MSKVKGSGGYIIADLTEEEEKRARIGDEFFIGSLGMIDEKRIRLYHCNTCNKDFNEAPLIRLERSNKELEEVTLIEEGEYICKACNSVLALFKRFTSNVTINDKLIPVNKFIGMNVFDDKARAVGSVENIYIHNNNLILRIKKDESVRDVAWEKIIAINDIVLIKTQSYICSNCNYINKEGAKFCEQCGSML